MGKSSNALIQLILYVSVLHPLSDVQAISTSDFDFRYMKFVYNATDDILATDEEYDYIVVGGGTAGCPLAATLSANYSVLLLERGGVPAAYPNVLKEDGVFSNLMQEDDGKAPVERFTSEDGVANVRGRVLGGSSMINVGLYSRADKKFYQKSGIEWDMDLVGKAYEWVESTLVFRSNLSGWQSVVKEALLESGVGPDNGFNLEHIQGTKVTGSIYDDHGRRHGAVELLNGGDPKNLRVAVHATVEKIIFSSNASPGLSARGIMYADSNGRSHRAFVRAKGEVILSAGSIGSPQLLLLSGVGPDSYLSSLNIPVVHPQPHIGQFMRDNPRNYITILPPFQLQPSSAKIVGIASDIYIETFSGHPFSTPPFSIFPDPSYNYKINSSFGQIVVKSQETLSYGSLSLQSSNDVKVGPNVRFNYFANPRDLDRCVIGLSKMGNLLKTKSLEPFKARGLPGIEGFNFYGPSLPKNDKTHDTSFESFCRDTVGTFWHYHGGCVVGKVVDGGLRVRGVNALRVVDGSVFNLSPGTNPQATVMMFGRYVGLKILEERSTCKEC